MSTLPLLVPTFAVGVVLAFVLRGRVSRALAMPGWAAWLLVASLGLVVALTLTPQRWGTPAATVFAAFDGAAGEPVGTPLWRWPWQWWPVDARTWNVLLFVPLGVAVAFVGRRGVRWVLVAGLLAAPLAIEGVQYAVAWLVRDPQWQDVVDNVTGAVLGLALGALLRATLRRRTPPPTRPHPPTR